MALTQTQVSQLYVMILGRASEGEGNEYWQTVGTNVQATADLMLASPGAKKFFGDKLNSNEEFATHIYQNLLNREPDAEGLAYWVGRLETEGVTKGQVISEMLNALMNQDDTEDKKIFENKVAVSDFVAEKIYNVDLEDQTLFEEFISKVTQDASSVEAAKKAVTAEANKEITGDIQYLDETRDVLKGTDANDLFVADVIQNQNGEQVNTLGSGDRLDGGKGVDTLEATLISAYNVAGNAMDITPTTNNIENVIINAQLSDNKKLGGIENTVNLNATKMDGVVKISSKHSDADLLVKNMSSITKGLYDGSTKDQTVEFAYSGNADTNWKQADMTVLYDQDYLVRNAENENSIEIRLANLYENKKQNEPIVSFDSIIVELTGKGTLTVDITDAQGLKGKEAYDKIFELLNAAFEEAEWDVSAKTLSPRDLIFSDDVAEYVQGENAGVYWPILVTNKGSEPFKLVDFTSNNKSEHGNRLETWVKNPIQSTDTPVSINVDLEKVGSAADGGSLVIGSMNKDYANEYGKYQDITTTDTVAGFDEFNVHVKGDKTKNSSLSNLSSTNNTLRKVTIDSAEGKNGKYADLTIGNSNTVVATPTNGIVDSDDAANAFKDVQIMDASAFKGDLTLNAGITGEIVEKYLNNYENTTLYGLNKELAHFEYKGGSGNDVLNIFIENVDAITDTLASNFLADVAYDGTNAFATGAELSTNGKNVFDMDINGGAGDDEITVKFDINTIDTTVFSGTNITINGGAGNDTIDISGSNYASTPALTNSLKTFTVAFEGKFGHDTIIGFDVAAATTDEIFKSDEVQAIDLTGFVAHKDETIFVTVGDKTTSFKATADMTDVQIANKVVEMLEVPTSGTATATQLFDNGSVGVLTAPVIENIVATGIDVKSVTVEVRNQVEANGTYDKDTTPIHTTESVTLLQGGINYSADGAIDPTDFSTATPSFSGLDILDFSAYKVDALVTLESVYTGTNLITTATAKVGTISTSGDKFLALIESEHKQGVYDVYQATQTTAGLTIDEVKATGALGSIDLSDTTTNITAAGSGFIDGSQFLI